MSSSENPQIPPPTSAASTPTGIQTPPLVEANAVVLTPLPQPPAIAVATFSRLRGWLDVLLVAGVLVFAFLIASFPVSNPDFFRQLATGRLVAKGEYPFGVDPFVYSGDGYIVNHSWLFGLLMYYLYQFPTVGGAVVVIFKALLTAALAELMVRSARRPGQSMWIPSVCTALAILVLSPRLYLQSTCLSYAFLGLTLWLLTTVRPGGNRYWWLLPPLFALWVNCDSWFFLGPLTVALYLVGELLQHALSGEEAAADHPAAPTADMRKLGMVLAVGVAACLINPHHFHALTLPDEFGFTPAGNLVEGDPHFRAQFLSPLRKDYYESNLGWSVAGLAYWPLLLLGLTSFAMVFGQVPWWRLLVWMGFALMSLYNTRAVPFFAVVAGPIAALNWLDYAAHRLGDAPRLTKAWRNWSLGGRVLTLLVGLVLLLATVPGWLQAQPRDYRRLGWGVRVDPSLEAMAHTIYDWRKAALLPDDPHWFNMHHEVANYLAWFASGERVFVDQGLPHFRNVAEDYLTLRRNLEELPAESANADGGEPPVLEKIRRFLRKYQVRYWIFDNLNVGKAEMVARALLFASPKEWILCDLKGRTALFAWRDPHPPEAVPQDRLEKMSLNLQDAAFGSHTEAAPPSGPDPSPRAHPWWEEWWRANPPLSLDREAAVLYGFIFQAQEEPHRMQQVYRYARDWQAAVAAGAIATSSPIGPLPTNLLALNWSWTYHDFPVDSPQPSRRPRDSEVLAMQARRAYTDKKPLDPPASLYLGIRAARRTLLADPEDGSTYFRLGQAYERLSKQLLEVPMQDSVPALADIRRSQIAAAFYNCLRWDVNLDNRAEVHEALYYLYIRLNYFDAATHHLRLALNARTAMGPSQGESATQFNTLLDRMSTSLTGHEAELESRLNRYDVNAAAKTELEKVKIALEYGLTDTVLTALDQFAQENVVKLDINQQMLIRRVTKMTLDLGRLDKARELLPDRASREGRPVRPEDVELYVRYAAAQGDYEEADRILSEALSAAGQSLPGQAAFGDRIGTAQAVVRVLLGESLRGTLRIPSPYPLFPSEFWVRRARFDAVNFGLHASERQAEWHLMRGWLALESGHCTEARRELQTVRDLTVSIDNWVPEVHHINAWLNPREEIPSLQKLGNSHTNLHNLSLSYLKWLEEGKR